MPRSPITATQIVAQVVAAYRALDTLKVEGSIVRFDAEPLFFSKSRRTDFSLLLGRPHRYRIEWSSPAHSGAMWNEDGHPYIYLSAAGCYAKMPDHHLAFAAATGVSYGSAWWIPSIFFPKVTGSGAVSVWPTQPVIGDPEMVDDEECHVLIEGYPEAQPSKIWVSKSRFSIRKRAYVLGGDAVKGKHQPIQAWELARTLRAMSAPTSWDAIRGLSNLMRRAFRVASKSKHRVCLETYDSTTSPKLAPDSFDFVPPPGATLKKSLWSA